MTGLSPRRTACAVASMLALAVVASACGDSGGSSSNADKPECANFKDFQGNSGKRVTVFASIRDVEADLLEKAWKPFVDCTGIKVEYAGSGEFESQLKVRVDGGNAPDVAFIPQPGLLASFAKDGKLKAASSKVKDLAERNWPAEWLKYSTVDGTFYGAPVGSNVKSFVWYSPGTFKDKGWKIPTTWDELITLSDTIAASGSGIRPWCAGIESGTATGWPATDWMEDVMLRENGPDVYDQWVNHQIPFNDPKVVAVADRVGSILKNDKYVGNVRAIATTAFQEGGLPILQNKCAMHRQASFYAAQWPTGTKVAEDGAVFAFYLPVIDASKGRPVLAAGEFAVGFADRPEVQAFQAYLATSDFANSRAKLGAWVSGNKNADVANFESPIDKLSVRILQDPQSQLRFDGSDLMPSGVGAGSFWKGMTDWINGKDTKSTLDFIEGSWPT